MPIFQTVLGQLNAAFHGQALQNLANQQKDAFAPGKPLAAGIVVPPGSPLFNEWRDFLDQMPGGFKESLRNILHYALNTSPPTEVTFAWAPGYDYELTIWQAPDTQTTKGGITVLVKTRYPSDAHPLYRPSP
jgi:hypothetical protein